MNKEEILFGLLCVLIFIIMYFYIDFVIYKKTKCIKGKTHDWIFICNSKGDTGDLGFGIKGFWNINHYKCSNCGKSKEDEIY